MECYYRIGKIDGDTRPDMACQSKLHNFDSELDQHQVAASYQLRCID